MDFKEIMRTLRTILKLYGIPEQERRIIQENEEIRVYIPESCKAHANAIEETLTSQFFWLHVSRATDLTIVIQEKL